MCAGSAQVTLVELRRSYYTGCKPNRRTKHPNTNQPKTKNTKNTKREGSNLLRNSCGRVSREREGETGALNSAKLSVLLVPQQTAQCLISARHSQTFWRWHREANLTPLHGFEAGARCVFAIFFARVEALCVPRGTSHLD